MTASWGSGLATCLIAVLVTACGAAIGGTTTSGAASSSAAPSDPLGSRPLADLSPAERVSACARLAATVTERHLPRHCGIWLVPGSAAGECPRSQAFLDVPAGCAMSVAELEACVVASLAVRCGRLGGARALVGSPACAAWRACQPEDDLSNLADTVELDEQQRLLDEAAARRDAETHFRLSARVAADVTARIALDGAELATLDSEHAELGLDLDPCGLALGPHELRVTVIDAGTVEPEVDHGMEFTMDEPESAWERARVDLVLTGVDVAHPVLVHASWIRDEAPPGDTFTFTHESRPTSCP